jgi:UV DNA damage endonuclease
MTHHGVSGKAVRKPTPPGTPRPAPPASAATRPRLGLVCVTAGPEVRYRTITRTRFLLLPEAERFAKLEAIYRDNVATLYGAVDYCHARGIRLYRATSALFPQVDSPAGKDVLAALAPAMAPFGRYADERGVRVVLHPDQYVVLNSESDAIRAQSLAIMADHALAFDLLGLPRSAWSCMILHGGKGGHSDFLVGAIASLPEPVRSRLVLENDERAYGAAEILGVCQRAGVPMVFDAHHHAVREKLDGYEHASVRAFTDRAASTWPDPSWQIVHVSNGRASFADPRHSEMITAFPSAFRDAPWVEVEAKAKEQAIVRLRAALERPEP